MFKVELVDSIKGMLAAQPPFIRYPYKTLASILLFPIVKNLVNSLNCLCRNLNEDRDSIFKSI